MFSKVENKLQWSSLLDKALFKTFFHSLDWENFLEKEFSWLKFERYISNDELLVSIARCKLFGKEKLVSHPLCEYGGPLPIKESADLSGFMRDFTDKFWNKARIKFHPYIFQFNNSPQPPSPRLRESEAGLILRGGEMSTFWIEDFSKKSKADLWNNFRKTLRNELEQEEGDGVHIEECRNRKDLEVFYALYLATARRHKNIPFPFSFFEFFHVHEFAKIFLAKRGGEVVGGSVFLFYKPFIHYFINASDYKFRNLNIGHKILWYAMQKYVGYPIPHIYDYFDLGGTRKGSALEVFKRGWGAKEHPIYERGTRGGRSGNSFLRDILGFIPAPLMRRLAPVALWAKI